MQGYPAGPATVGGASRDYDHQLQKAAAQAQQYPGTNAPPSNPINQRGLFTALAEVEEALSRTQEVVNVLEGFFQLSEPEDGGACAIPTSPKERLDYVLSRIRRTNYKLEKIAQHVGT